ncbi:zinc-dependent metalloprotease family protein [Psychroflexus halocasei]|uniref:Metallo-peptidase family M12B Reprolysin-like n=1 Tax=Psychroflexus halocasei TaxID=908615 RepID=A0A1H3VRT8_9FLAO|nr:zinc-dependent metalloprotease family protein [Psychroflexus halocasei]SDZ77523.1 Metallo-peptidase family M12B Reprolysin-like [Psychroflexus halocasei]
MKLRKLILLIALIFSATIYSQNSICGTQNGKTLNPETVINSGIYSASTDENYLNTFPQRNLNIAIWGIERTDGLQSISQLDAYNMMEYLNGVYNEFNVCFNLMHFGYIVSDEHYDTTSTNIYQLFDESQINSYDGIAIRVIVPHNLNFRGIAWGSSKLSIKADQITTGIFIHEIGHNLGLKHTHHHFDSSICETVTRDSNDQNYNANIFGDSVTDTQASPEFYGSNMQYVSMDCNTYTGNLTDCEGTPYTITVNEIQNFMAYTRQHCRTLFTTGQKIRIHETIEYHSNGHYINILDDDYIDLYSSNSNLDNGIEPDGQTGVIWDSPDIWVRNQQDGFDVHEHEDLHYIDDNTPVYVYVRLKNKSCNPSLGTDSLELYWAKGGIGEQIWPDVWQGFNNSFNSLDIGNQIGSQNIPITGSEDETILEFQWQPKNPDVYENAGFTSKPWMFCFLSRIVSAEDPITFPEGSSAATNTRNNNNIVYKNTTTVNLSQNSYIGSISAGNYNTTERVKSNINFFTNENNLIWQEAEIRVKLSENLWNTWQESGGHATNIKVSSLSDREVYILGNNSSLDNIDFKPNEWGILTPQINFLIRKVTDATYTLNVSQTISESGMVLGGFTYHINRDYSRQYFTANAKVEVDQNNTIIDAESINENAIYNWYDQDGKFIISSQTLSVTNAALKDYKLEVIAESDGHKDYKTFTVKESRNIESIFPNPTQNDFNINYNIGTASTGYIIVTHVITGVSYNYLLDVTATYGTINLSNKPSGQYIINLVTDNVIVDTKHLLKN